MSTATRCGWRLSIAIACRCNSGSCELAATRSMHAEARASRSRTKPTVFKANSRLEVPGSSTMEMIASSGASDVPPLCQ